LELQRFESEIMDLVLEEVEAAEVDMEAVAALLQTLVELTSTLLLER
jgi:hypothetical protein